MAYSKDSAYKLLVQNYWISYHNKSIFYWTSLSTFYQAKFANHELSVEYRTRRRTNKSSFSNQTDDSFGGKFCVAGSNDENGTLGSTEENENPLNKYKYSIPLGYLFIGIGGMVTWPLSLSFIDSNAKPGESGILIATNFLIIMLGPMIGYSMGGFFLKIWVNITSGCAPELLDPRSTSWVGAWWMGYLIPLVGVFVFK